MADTYWTLHKAPPDSPKKWAVRVPTSSGRGKTVLFGARGYEDFTTHGDVERRERYRTRHQHDRIDDPTAPGFWSWWALWGESDDLKTAFAAAVRRAKKTRRNPSVDLDPSTGVPNRIPSRGGDPEELSEDELRERGHLFAVQAGSDARGGEAFDMQTAKALGQIPPVGTWRMDPVLGYLEQLQRVPVDELTFTESTEDRGIRRSVEKYVGYYEAGLQPPPAEVVWNVPTQKLVTLNRRRVLAAKEAGVQSILAWVGGDTFENMLARQARRNPSPISTGVDEMLATDTYKPQVGDRHAFAPPGMYPFDAVVLTVSGDMATVVRTDPGEPPGVYGVKMPAESVAHFANDLRGVVYGPPSDDPAVDVVVHGDAVFLGKGDDGLAFLVDTLEGPLVVKASTTVPFQPFNPNHLTPAKAAARLEAQQAASDAMAEAGIPGILPSQFVLNGDGAAVKGFMLKPWVEIPEHLTRAQLDEVAASVEAAHKTGWVFRDDLQVGLWNGEVYHFDTGKAEYVGVGKKSDPDDYWSDAHTDVQNLKRLFAKHSELYLTKKEQQNPITELEALYGVDARSLTPEERKKYRGLVLRLGQQIKTYLKNHPDEEHGFWSEIPEYADEEIRDMMARFKEPT